MFDKFTLGYTGVAAIVAKKSIRSVIIMGVVLLGTGILGKFIPGGFVPEEDEGYFLVKRSTPGCGLHGAYR
jgi:HAE1 family hydrophobic/amphiphilic exporter-1